MLLLCLSTGALWAAPPAPEAAAQQPAPRDQAGALHGQSWAFGQSEDRKEAIWRRGMPAQSLKQRAVAGAAPAGKAGSKKGSAQKGRAGPSGAAKPAAGASAPGQGTAARPAQGAMDTESGIDRALAAAQAMAEAEAAEAAKARQAKPKGSLGLSMKDTTTTWNVTPMREAMRPDEVLVRDR
ncbi:MAG: hypothetical protein K2G99_06890, partial [Desulfovibrio sp.]|nr:hypothetical protein [Desulfovibrio sp.]